MAARKQEEKPHKHKEGTTFPQPPPGGAQASLHPSSFPRASVPCAGQTRLHSLSTTQRIAQEGIWGQTTFPGQTEPGKACLTNRSGEAALQQRVLFGIFARRKTRNSGKKEGMKRDGGV